MDLDKYKKSYEEIMELQRTKNVDFYKHPARYYLEPFKIAGNVYYIGDKKVCSHLIDTGDGLIVFDSGFQHTIHLLVQAIWELGFNPKDIRYLIHSHEHFDAVESRMGISIVPSLPHKSVFDGRLCYLALEKEQNFKCSFSAVTEKGTILTPALKRLIEVTREVYAKVNLENTFKI